MLETSSVKVPTLFDMPVIASTGGEVRRVLRHRDDGFHGFKEAYVSKINNGCCRGWKCHTLMTCNLTVVFGQVRFVIRYADPSDKGCQFEEFLLSASQNQRLTIPPGFFFAFQGTGGVGGIVLNIANEVHDPEETITVSLEDIPYDWSE